MNPLSAFCLTSLILPSTRLMPNPSENRAQEFGVLPRIEVVRVVDVCLGRCREFVGLRRLQLEAVFAELGLDAEFQAAQPEVVELAHPGRLAIPAEGMDVAIALQRPVLERDAELERCGGRAHELLLVDLQELVKDTDRWNGRFANSDGADFFGFDQRDVDETCRAAATTPRPPASPRCRRRRSRLSLLHEFPLLTPFARRQPILRPRCGFNDLICLSAWRG